MDAGEESEEGLCHMDLLFTDVKCTPAEEDRRSFQVELAVQAQADSFPRGEAYVLWYVGVIATVVFYNRPHWVLPIAFPWGRWAGAGSDEGGR